MTSTFFQLLNRKPINIREINRQVFEELKKCLPKNWEIIFKLKDNLVNKPPDNSDITKYEWIIAYFSDSSKYNLAYLFNEDLKKPLSARKYPVLPLNHYSLSISLDSEILILSEYQDNNTDTRTSKSYSLSQVKKVYICKINDKAISQLLKESMNEREQTVIKIGKYKIFETSTIPIGKFHNPITHAIVNAGSSIQMNFHYTLNSNNNQITYNVYPAIAQDLATQQIPYYGDYVAYCLALIQNDLQYTYLHPLVDKIRSISSDPDDQARIAISLVQHIPYDYSKLQQVNRITRYPYQVLSDKLGVCGEKSKLLAFLLKELGFGVVLFSFETESHMAVGIGVDSKYGAYGTNYAFVESTTPSIVTDNQSDYAGVGKLKSLPVIIPISIGQVYQYERVEEEYNDCKKLNNFLSMGKTLDKFHYTQWKQLYRKYGMDYLRLLIDTSDGKRIVLLTIKTKISRKEIGYKGNTLDENKLIGEVVQNPNDPKVWGIKNLMPISWRVTFPDKVVDVPSGKSVPIRRGIKIDISGITAEIIS